MIVLPSTPEVTLWFLDYNHSSYKPVNFADLPSDTITVTVHFTNGQRATRQLNLSFDRYDNLIAEITNKSSSDPAELPF